MIRLYPLSVIPAKAGTQGGAIQALGPRLRGDDGVDVRREALS
jgi:hypothetical protein